MITFNTILKDAKIDPRDVQLVRHQVRRSKVKITPYSLWTTDPSQFEAYQSIQTESKFHIGKYIASFVVTPKNEVLFVGLYSVISKKKATRGTISPVSGEDCSRFFKYDLRPQKKMQEYIGCLIVEWNKGAVAWVQHATTTAKPVLEIRNKKREGEWPGSRNFSHELKHINNIPKSWKDILAKTQGIYILVCPKTGMKYIGSAKSENGGFFQRFCSYKDGHGGNKELKKFDTSRMIVSILERVDPGTSQIEEIEQVWKNKLFTRTPFGLNAN